MARGAGQSEVELRWVGLGEGQKLLFFLLKLNMMVNFHCGVLVSSGGVGVSGRCQVSKFARNFVKSLLLH